MRDSRRPSVELVAAAVRPHASTYAAERTTATALTSCDGSHAAGGTHSLGVYFASWTSCGRIGFFCFCDDPLYELITKGLRLAGKLTQRFAGNNAIIGNNTPGRSEKLANLLGRSGDPWCVISPNRYECMVSLWQSGFGVIPPVRDFRKSETPRYEPVVPINRRMRRPEVHPIP